jgi:hypothetical protein
MVEKCRLACAEVAGKSDDRYRLHSTAGYRCAARRTMSGSPVIWVR